MEPGTSSKFSEFYKSFKTQADLQRKRRKLLLDEQKKKREQQQDSGREIHDLYSKLHEKNYTNCRKHKTYSERHGYNHKLQESEWLREKPEDFSEWFLVPVPKGQRCLVISTSGRTEMYNKRGKYQKSFHSNLPGDKRLKNQITILDCIYCDKLKRFYVLDTISSCNQEMIDCDTEFRFFWIKTKFIEDHYSGSSSQMEYTFVPVDYFSLDDETAVTACLDRYPHYEDDCPKLDGILFYHKRSSYVFGTTPLVGWLFPFMMPEILGIPVNEKFLLERPCDYIDSKLFMEKFDQELVKKRIRHSRHKSNVSMDVVASHEDEVDESSREMDNIVECERNLELEGRKFDDSMDDFGELEKVTELN